MQRQVNKEMVNLFTEFLFGVAQVIYLGRILYQAKVSKEKGQSVTPITYWLITICASIVLMVYGVFSESIIIPLTTIVTVTVALYHINIELKRERISLSKEGAKNNE